MEALGLQPSAAGCASAFGEVEEHTATTGRGPGAVRMVRSEPAVRPWALVGGCEQNWTSAVGNIDRAVGINSNVITESVSAWQWDT